MADEIRKIANLRTEASAPDLPGRVQNEEFVFDEMIGAELAQEVCRHKDIRSVEKLFSLADPIMISGAGDSQKALLTAMAANLKCAATAFAAWASICTTRGFAAGNSCASRPARARAC